MRKNLWICRLLIIVICCAGCSSKKRLDERLTLRRGDKIPYGTFYAYENLNRLFPMAEIRVTSTSPYSPAEPSFTQTPSESEYKELSRSARIIISRQMEPDKDEVNALFNYVGQGNHLFISAFMISEDFLDSLHLKTGRNSGLLLPSDSLRLSVVQPVTQDSLGFSYPGKAYDNAFASIDSSITQILGRDASGEVNFVKLTFESGGSITVHLAPLAFSNFFLLHRDNKAYYDNALSYLPHDITRIEWDDYFRMRKERSTRRFSKLSAFLNNDILRWAFWLAVLLFGIIYLFESKRKQPIVPVRGAMRNVSLDFVKTIGRLYFQRRDNKNLALKMSAHFLDNIRTRYNIPTSVLNEDFENRLAYKSDYDRSAIREIVSSIKSLPDQASVSDEELLSFNDKLDKFLKHH